MIGKSISFYTLTLRSWISGEYLYLGTSLPNTALLVNDISKVTDQNGNIVLDTRNTCRAKVDHWGGEVSGCSVSKTYNVKIKSVEQSFTYTYIVELLSTGCNDSGYCSYAEIPSQKLLPQSVTFKPN